MQLSKGGHTGVDRRQGMHCMARSRQAFGLPIRHNAMARATAGQDMVRPQQSIISVLATDGLWCCYS